jgi:hypothetical protein
MNPIIKKMLLVGFTLLATACAHYPHHYAYYPGYDSYSNGYYSYHGDYHDHGHRHDYGRHYGGNNFSHHRHDRGSWNNDSPGRRQRPGNPDRSSGYSYNREHHDNDYSRHGNHY